MTPKQIRDNVLLTEQEIARELEGWILHHMQRPRDWPVSVFSYRIRQMIDRRLAKLLEPQDER